MSSCPLPIPSASGWDAQKYCFLLSANFFSEGTISLRSDWPICPETRRRPFDANCSSTSSRSHSNSYLRDA
ncbi:MAG: hypothetical protein SGPRY_009308 [Prymnesium sp.]